MTSLYIHWAMKNAVMCLYRGGREREREREKERGGGKGNRKEMIIDTQRDVKIYVWRECKRLPHV